MGWNSLYTILTINTYMNVFGYARVSTKEQKLEVQEDAIEKTCKYRNFNLMRIFEDKASGSNTERPEFKEMIESIEDKNLLSINGIVIYKLDRIGRSVRDLLKFVDWCKSHNIEFISITENIDTTTAQGRFFFYIMGAVAEYERELIRERIDAGKRRYVATGGKFGRKEKKIPMNEVNRLISEGVPVAKVARMFKVSRTTLYNRRNQE